MTDQAFEMSHILLLAGLASATWIVYFWFIHDYRVDGLRQRLFILRDKFFDAAAVGLISFDHPAYRMVRESINAQIRFAHRLNFRNVLFAMGTFKILHVEPERRDLKLDRELHPLDPIVRNVVEHTYREMQSIVLRHLLLGAPILFLPVFALAFVVIIRSMYPSGLRLIKRALSAPQHYWRRFEEELVRQTPEALIDIIETEAETYQEPRMSSQRASF